MSGSWLCFFGLGAPGLKVERFLWEPESPFDTTSSCLNYRLSCRPKNVLVEHLSLSKGIRAVIIYMYLCFFSLLWNVFLHNIYPEIVLGCFEGLLHLYNMKMTLGHCYSLPHWVRWALMLRRGHQMVTTMIRLASSSSLRSTASHSDPGAL